MMNNHRYKYFNLLLLLIVFSCTENLLWDDEEPGDVISGSVIMHGVDSPEKVWVWFSEFNFVTHPDANGKFEIPVPSIDSPVSGQSVTGHFPIYFYQNNYAVDSILVEFVNGKLVTPQPAIDEQFNLNDPIQMQKLIEVTTEAYFIDDTTIGLETYITPIVDSVRVRIYGQIFQGYLEEFAGVVLVNLNSDRIAIHLREDLEVIYYNFNTPTLWLTEAVFDANATQKGTHDLVAVPFLVVMHDGIEHIRERVGLEKETYTANYIHLPFSREGGAVEF